MPIFYPDILTQHTAPRTFSFSEKDVILYALGIGMPADPLNETELQFVSERKLNVIPSAVTVLAKTNFFPADETVCIAGGARKSSLDVSQALHGEQKFEIYKPLPTAGTFVTQDRVVAAFDKGRGRGGVVVTETVWTDAAGEECVKMTSSVFARGDGGFGGPPSAQPMGEPAPRRTPDQSLTIETRKDQALLYRLNGDRNPLHFDPASAKRAGFPRPILHGLCSFGITCRAVLQMCAKYEPHRILSHEGRFSAPVFPGDALTVHLWQDNDKISFEAEVKERGVTAIKGGATMLRYYPC